MPLGENPLDVASALTVLFDTHKEAVTLQPTQADEAVERDKFGKPINPLTPLTVNILVDKASEVITPTVAGAKPVERLEFYALPGTIHENDEITWNGHAFRVDNVWPFGLGGANQMEFCKAEREIDR